MRTRPDSIYCTFWRSWVGLSLLIATVGFLVSPQSHPNEWSRFRGPNGGGVSMAVEVPVEFGPKRNVVWRTQVPPGNSSPVLTRDRVFLTGVEAGKLLVLALDRVTGKLLWKRATTPRQTSPLRSPNSPASPTPVTDGRNVYAFFQDFGLVAYGPGGERLWELPLGPFRNQYGMASSPILAGATLVLQCDQSLGSFLLAVDRDSGKVLWRQPRPDVSDGYSTPVIRETGDIREVITAGSFELAGYRLDTGVKSWWFHGLAWQIKAIPTLHGDTVFLNGWGSSETGPERNLPKPQPFPEVLAHFDTSRDGRISPEESPDERVRSWFAGIDRDGDGLIDETEWKFYAALLAGDGGLLAIRAGGQGDITRRGPLWRFDKSVPEISSSLFYRGVLYLINDGGVAMAFQPESGKLLKRKRLPGPSLGGYYASPVAADGKVLLVSERGVVTVLEAGEDLNVLAVNPLGEDCYATPALADGRVFLRTDAAVYAFGDRPRLGLAR